MRGTAPGHLPSLSYDKGSFSAPLSSGKPPDSAVSVTHSTRKDKDERRAAETKLSKHAGSEESIILSMRLQGPGGDSVAGQTN